MTITFAVIAIGFFTMSGAYVVREKDAVATIYFITAILLAGFAGAGW